MDTTIRSAPNPLGDAVHDSGGYRIGEGVVRLLPALEGRVEAKAIRVPVVNVSAIDLVANLRQAVKLEDVRGLLRGAADGCGSGRMAFTAEPHARRSILTTAFIRRSSMDSRFG